MSSKGSKGKQANSSNKSKHGAGKNKNRQQSNTVTVKSTSQVHSNKFWKGNTEIVLSSDRKKRKKLLISMVIKEPIYAVQPAGMSFGDFTRLYNINPEKIFRLNPEFSKYKSDSSAALEFLNKEYVDQERYLVIGFCYVREVFNELQAFTLVKGSAAKVKARAEPGEGSDNNESSQEISSRKTDAGQSEGLQQLEGQQGLGHLEELDTEISLENLAKNAAAMQAEIHHLSTQAQEQNGRLKSLSDDLKNTKQENSTLSERNNFLKGEVARLQASQTSLEEVSESQKGTIENLGQQKVELEDALQKEAETLSHYQQHVCFADFLQDYCKQLTSLLSFFKEIESYAFSYWQTIKAENFEVAQAVESLLLKFLSRKPADAGNWDQRISDMASAALVTDIELMANFSSKESGEEKLAHFKRFVFVKVLKQYASCVLILVEELRNLDRFVPGQKGGQFNSKKFAEDRDGLISKMTAAGIEPKYVPLFENYEKFAREVQIGDTNQMHTLNKRVSGLENGTIKEIIEYKFRYEGETPDRNRTIVIIT